MSVNEETAATKDVTRFRNRFSAEIKRIDKGGKTHFDRNELEALSFIYMKLLHQIEESNSAPGCITRFQFRSILHIVFNMPEDTMINRIMVGLDKGMTPYVTLETWIYTFSLFLRGTLNEKIDYCFKCYDILGEGMMRRYYILQLLRKTVIKHNVEDVDDAVKDLVGIIIKKMDLDRDGAISYQEFRNSVYLRPMMLQCFGQVLPDKEAVHAFLLTFTDKIDPVKQ